MNGKFILASKTIAFNLFSLALFYGQALLNVHILEPQTQLLLTALVNLALRTVTTQPVTFSPSAPPAKP